MSRLSITYAESGTPPSKGGVFQVIDTDVDVTALTDKGPLGIDGAAVNKTYKRPLQYIFEIQLHITLKVPSIYSVLPILMYT